MSGTEAGLQSGAEIDCWRFASEQREAELQISISSLGRLDDVLAERDGFVYAKVRGVLEGSKAFLHLEVQGCLQLVCQRCLGAVDWPCEIDAVLQVIRGEPERHQAENDVELSVDDLEDLVVADPEMTLERLIEDELLLSMPISAMHDNCAPKVGNGIIGASSPFAGLRDKLKNQSKE